MTGYGLNTSDVYGSLFTQQGTPTSAAPAQDNAGDEPTGSSPSSIKFSWITIIGILVVIRLLYEKAE